LQAWFFIIADSRKRETPALKKLFDFRLDNGLLGYLLDGGKVNAWAFDNLLALISLEIAMKSKEAQTSNP